MTIDDADKLFWQETVKGVKSQKSEEIYLDKPQRGITINQRQHYAVKQEFSEYSKCMDEDDIGGIDKSTLRKFKKEEFPIEEVLDLHGLTEDAAFVKVDDFIPKCYGEGKRCVIIITGKGEYRHNQDDIYAPRGVLKKLVPQWLDMPRLRGMILAYRHPSERLGGNGALLILLRRKRLG